MSEYDLHAKTLEPTDSVVDAERTEAVLTLAGHPDLDRIGDVAVLGSQEDFRAGISRSGPTFFHPTDGRGAPLGDRYLSREPALFVGAKRDGAIGIHRSHPRVSIQVDGVPLDEKILVDAAAMESGIVIELARRVVLVLHHRDPIERSSTDHGLVGHSDGIHAVRVHHVGC